MRKLIFLLPVAILFLGGCLKSDTTGQTAQIIVPVGTFTGQFRKIHRSTITGKLDTLKAAFNLVMSIDSGFRVTADTTTIHAGSRGAFQVTSNYINFVDSTYPKTGTPPKTHLSGSYPYYYDGSVLQMTNIIAVSDSVYYQYDLKKTK